MGKNPKPLSIFVVGPIPPAISALVQKGHSVTSSADLGDYDLILGPTCARFLPGMEKFLDAFIKGARAVKYKGKKDD